MRLVRQPLLADDRLDFASFIVRMTKTALVEKFQGVSLELFPKIA